MRHVYHAHLNDGRRFDVETPHHHDDHDDDDFKRILFDIIKSSISGVISGTVVHFLYKGKKA